MDGCGGDGRRPRAVFMAFGTHGDVFPIAALAAAFSLDQQQYSVVFITHSAHQNLSAHLAASNVRQLPFLDGSVESNAEYESFSRRKETIQIEHREECLSYVEEVFGNDPSIRSDFIVINFFALEGWHLAELFQVKCIIAAPYFVPYSAPTSFERQFKQSFPLLYKYFQEAPTNTVCWTDIAHWMWALFMETWGSWRNDCLNLSPIPYTVSDPVTNLPLWHVRAESPLLLYGFSKEIVERPGYWPSSAHVCGFWFLPMAWQFSCDNCRGLLCGNVNPSSEGILCGNHSGLEHYLMGSSYSSLPIFIGLSSIGRYVSRGELNGFSHVQNDLSAYSSMVSICRSMGFLRNPKAFLMVIKAVIESTDYRFILFSSGYQPLDSAIRFVASSVPESSELEATALSCDSTLLFNSRLFCFSGSIPYSWLFPKCAAAIHHAGSGSTAAALFAGIPQVACPFLLDQFYWAERLHWLGVAPEPLKRQHLVPDVDDTLSINNAADVLLGAIRSALSPEIKAQATRIAHRLAPEDGVGEALRTLKEKVLCE
ncbi:sterol 3-beta-glucosyltransferase UGT80B1 isoform X3 [Brachypodium distachyon]|uniref:sterol 3-beta-glucosyltransferase UGT80B1 isoform X3 n=1 Tax=Brachypodium distachyon TaxID=15368 RepID=UPI00071D94EE|nr:sterol 3-beta-glucosyltransferase UGT80B1 isoform X3 [Brachypodium distachyon]|eukprot:XP_014755473.1 sterol 3-beta-glucosyltransferase UGT80B1 isoform X3 [Brachypodium distachyon]